MIVSRSSIKYPCNCAVNRVRRIYIVTEHWMEDDYSETRVSLIIDDGKHVAKTETLSVTGTSMQQSEEVRRIVDMLKQVAIDIMPK